MRKFLLAFVFPVCVFFGMIAWIAGHPWLMSRVAKVVIERSLKDVRVQELRIARQHILSVDRCAWEKLSLSARFKGRPITIRAARVEVSGLSTWWSGQRIFLVKIDKAEVFVAPGQMQGVNAQISIRMKSRVPLMIEGPVTAEKAAWDKVRAEDISLRVSGNGGAMDFQDVQAHIYGGAVSGSGRVIFSPLGYSASLKVEGIDTWRLAEINDQLPAQIAGRLSGTVALSGDDRRILGLQAAVIMPSGGKVNAALLSTLTQYLPQSPEKKRLEALIKVGGKLAVEVFSFTIHSHTPDHLSGEVKLGSKEANLELNLTHDITADGTWEGIAQSWQAIFH